MHFLVDRVIEIDAIGADALGADGAVILAPETAQHASTGAEAFAFEQEDIFDFQLIAFDAERAAGSIRAAEAARAEAMKAAAAADPKIAELIAGKEIAKVVAVPGRLVNFVLRG